MSQPLSENRQQCIQILRDTLAEAHGPESTPMRALDKLAEGKAIHIKVARVEGLPGFAAYLAGTLSEQGKTTIELESNQALVVLDVQAVFDDAAVVQEDGSPIPGRTHAERKRELVEHLMHEFGHVLEEFFDLEFDEDSMDAIVASYEAKKG